MAGYDWLQLFLNLHPDLSVRVAEGVSAPCSSTLHHETVKNYVNLLKSVLTKNNLNKPGNIFNVDETGLQLYSPPGHYISSWGSKAVAAIRSGEKCATISLITCESSFLSPFYIFKEKILNMNTFMACYLVL